jgi:ribosomal protein S18 acetylase RimI-like enzyme
MLPPGYGLREGSGLDRAKLLKFMQLTYQELFPEQQDFSHLAETVESYFSSKTPLWWVEPKEDRPSPVACLWLGNAIDQVTGDRHAHIFLLYVLPEYRRRGIGKALVDSAENWARARGDRQMGLQVFQTNQPALNLYRQLGYQTQSLWMLKPL